MELMIKLTDIDYVSLISFASEKAGNLASRFLKGNLNTLAVSAVNIGNGFICSKIKRICSEKGVSISFDNISAESVTPEIIALTLDVQHVDVMSIIKLVMPGLQEKIKDIPKTLFISEFLTENDEKAMEAVSYFWDLLDTQTQDKLLKDAMNSYSDEIIHLIEGIAFSKNLKFKICEFSVQ